MDYTNDKHYELYSNTDPEYDVWLRFEVEKGLRDIEEGKER